MWPAMLLNGSHDLVKKVVLILNIYSACLIF